MKILKFMGAFIAIAGLMSLYAGQFHDTKLIQETIMREPGMQAGLQQKIKLFMYDGCPYCVKVHLFLESQNLLHHVEFVDAGLSENRELLKLISGRTQAPYLVDADAGVKMAESNDIIQYFAKKYTIQFAVPASITATLHQETHDQKSYNPATFISQVCTSKKPVIILVSTTWCPPCQQFKPIFLQVAQEFADQCDFICVDGDANRAIVQELGVTGYPTVVCYKNGQQINPKNYRSKAGLIKLIGQLR